jgi:hypothetical protein
LRASHAATTKISWFGDSVAHWEGDTLVVDTVGLDARSWVDNVATPHTDKLHVVDRYRRRDAGNLDVTVQVDDPGAFTTPGRRWRTTTRMMNPGSRWSAPRTISTPPPVSFMPYHWPPRSISDPGNGFGPFTTRTANASQMTANGDSPSFAGPTANVCCWEKRTFALAVGEG